MKNFSITFDGKDLIKMGFYFSLGFVWGIGLAYSIGTILSLVVIYFIK